jgi:hypothetical protein
MAAGKLECHPCFSKYASYGHPDSIVDSQYHDRGAAYRRNTDQQWSLIPKVIRPTILTGMVEASKRASERIQARNVRSLRVIASTAGQRQVREFRSPAMLTCDHVVNNVSKTGPRFWNVAILASIPGQASNDLRQLIRHFFAL